jgi:hypothetical protein
VTTFEAIQLLAEDKYSSSRKIKRFFEMPEGVLMAKRLESMPQWAIRLQEAVNDVNFERVLEVRDEVLWEKKYKTTKQLKEIAKNRGVPYYGRLTREELLKELGHD